MLVGSKTPTHHIHPCCSFYFRDTHCLAWVYLLFPLLLSAFCRNESRDWVRDLIHEFFRLFCLSFPEWQKLWSGVVTQRSQDPVTDPEELSRFSNENARLAKCAEGNPRSKLLGFVPTPRPRKDFAEKFSSPSPHQVPGYAPWRVGPTKLCHDVLLPICVTHFTEAIISCQTGQTKQDTFSHVKCPKRTQARNFRDLLFRGSAIYAGLLW